MGSSMIRRLDAVARNFRSVRAILFQKWTSDFPFVKSVQLSTRSSRCGFLVSLLSLRALLLVRSMIFCWACHSVALLVLRRITAHELCTLRSPHCQGELQPDKRSVLRKHGRETVLSSLRHSEIRTQIFCGMRVTSSELVLTF